jgi:hypothetical protein
MCVAGYVSVCMQLYSVGFHCLSLHNSAIILYSSILLHWTVQWVVLNTLREHDFQDALKIWHKHLEWYICVEDGEY